MKKEIKTYDKVISLTINQAIINININPQDASFNILLPLITTIGNNVIETSISYSSLANDELAYFGRGFKLNYYADFELLVGRIKMTNAKRESEEYYLKNFYFNKATQLEVKKINDDQYGITYHYTVKDLYGNVSYYSSNQHYPYQISFIDGDSIDIDFISSIKTISNGKNDFITFTKNNASFLNKIVYTHNDEIIKMVKIKYDDDDYIQQIAYYNDETLVSSLSFQFSENEIIIKDDLSLKMIKLILEDHHVISYINGSDNDFTSGKLITLTYQDYQTIIEDNLGNKKHYYFDHNGFPTLEIDSKLHLASYEFDQENHLVTFSSEILVLTHFSNLLKYSLTQFTKEGISLELYQENDEIFQQILTDSSYICSGIGTLQKSISGCFLANENYTLILFVKFVDENDSKIKITFKGDEEVSTTLENQNNNDFYQMIVLSIRILKTCYSLAINLQFEGDGEVILGGAGIYARSIGHHYLYDQKGNVTRIIKGNKITNLVYDDNNLLTSSDAPNSSLCEYLYNKKGQLVQGITPYGTIIRNFYDEDNQSNLIEQIIETSDNQILQNKQEYDDEGRFIVKKIDERNLSTLYNEIDQYGQAGEIINPKNQLLLSSYNENGSLNQLTIKESKKSSNSINTKYIYNDNDCLIKVIDNDENYHFTYDKNQNVTSFKIDDVSIYAYEYDDFNQNLTKLYYGSKDEYFAFNFDESGLLNTIEYHSNQQNQIKYYYSYNDQNLLAQVLDYAQELLYLYQYDEDNQISTIQTKYSSISYDYDDNKNILSKDITIDQYKNLSTYDHHLFLRGVHGDILLSIYQDKPYYIGSFEFDSLLTHNGEYISSITHNGMENIAPRGKVGNIPYVDLTNCDNSDFSLLTYRFPLSEDSQESGCIQFTFKIKTINTQMCLISLWDEQSECFLQVSLKNGKIIAQIIDSSGKVFALIEENCSYQVDQWHFIALNYFNDPNQNVFKVMIFFDGEIYSYEHTAYSFCFKDAVMVNIGHLYYGATSGAIKGYIAYLLIVLRKYLTYDEIYQFYLLSQELIEHNTYLDETGKTLDLVQNNHLNFSSSTYDQFEIYPLEHHPYSLKKRSPSCYDLRSIPYLNENYAFKYCPLTQTYGYSPSGENLIYNFKISTSGSLIFEVMSQSAKKQYLFIGKDNYHKSIGLFKNEDNLLVVYYCGLSFITNLTLSLNQSHLIAFSFSLTSESLSIESYTLEIRLILDDQKWIKTRSVSFTFQTLYFTIGQNNESVDIATPFGTYQESYPLIGQIRMMLTREAFCEDETIQKVLDEYEETSFKEEYDELGMMKNFSIHQKENDLLNKKFTYLTLSSSYLTKLISKEEISYLDNTYSRSYGYDNLGNLTSLKDKIFGNHTYQYDYRGYLIADNQESYAYDNYGNMIKKGDVVFSYDSVIKERLIKVGDQEVIYNSSNPLNPTLFGEQAYAYEGRRLTKFTINTYIYQYIYDDQGLRIQKNDNHGSQTRYIYENDRLINERANLYTLDFLYDYNQQLIGFIYNHQETYYYLRDCFLNILGILDNQGNLVVQYKYTPWGECTIVSDTSSSYIGKINPFRFKGYYYDNESKMYYCKQRYYVPSWGRWLNGDNLSNINFSDIKNLNLYLYCANNPIIYYDPNGDIVVSALVIGTIVGCAIGVVSSILYQGFTTKWQKINPYQVILDGLMGGICGLIGASGLNAIASALISGGLGFTNSVLGDLIESDGNTKEIDWLKASFMGVLNCFLSYKLCGAGSQNINDLGELLIKNSEVNKTFTIIANASDSYEAGLMSTRGFQGVLNLYSGQLSYAINNALTNIIYKKTIKGLMMFSVSTICAETGLFGYEFIKCIFNKKRW